jgi:signal transduction histidine kinase/CheY-like chemotaxis protein
MNAMSNESINTRILIIDDEELVRDDIEEILVPKKYEKNIAISNASSILFDEKDEGILTPAKSNIPAFIVDKAINGMEGFEKVRLSLEEKSPYALIFLDMRMPGWDGLETAIRIKEIDPKVEIVIVTAFSDKSIDDIIAKAGQNVGYHCKPYASEEILQLAIKGVNDYNKLRNLETLINIIANLSISENHLNTLLQNILDQLAMYIETDMAVMGKMENNQYEKLFSIGSLEEKINLYQLNKKISSANANQDDVIQIDEIIFAKLDQYAVFAVLKKDTKLKTEKLYLLRLFVQNAAKAIRNARLYEDLLNKEKLSAIGTSIGMLMHDLRTPIKNIPVLTELMRDDGVDNPLLEMIEQCGEQASEIFDDFLDFINETPLKKERVNLGNLIKEGIELANSKRAILPIKLIQSLDENLFVLGDASKLKRVFMNLVNNSVDAIKDLDMMDAIISVSASAEKDTINIVIKDSGPGIPEQIMQTLFNAFVTKQKGNGTGLGLAIVKQFIVAHRGTITVHNDQGAVFTITLPLAT